MYLKSCILFLLLACLLIADEPRRLTENEHSDKLAEKYNALREVVLWDKSRVDLANNEYVIEVDFAHKWTEAIGQALYYSIADGRKPAVLLLWSPGDERYIYRCQAVCAKYGIKLYLERVVHE